MNIPSGYVASRVQFDTQKVKDRMSSIGVNASALAKQLGVNELTIYRHINGLRKNLLVQDGMAKALKCKIEDLC